MSLIEDKSHAALRRKQRNFLDALQRAKRDLSGDLLAKPGAYHWAEGHLSIEIGSLAKPGSIHDDKPLAWNADPETFPQMGRSDTIKVANERAELSYGRDKKDGSPFVKLQIAPEAFQRPLANTNEDFRGDKAKVHVGDLTEILAKRIPELAAASTKDKVNSAWWIVTGRAALWPMVYAGIADVVKETSGRILEKPFRPSEMKEAVLEGALRLAVETALPLTTNTPPSIGIVVRESDTTTFVTLKVGEPRSFPISAQNRLHLVRMLPGLDKVKNATEVCLDFESADLSPWTR